ncbi:MAG TPA: SRPBCC domain-containing protein [Solirubrobacteraceae bacterium]|nr:SRPBCC domain-containing protein [Solirubrobacteraceae bacterium]
MSERASASEAAVVRLERTFAAPAEDVFDAWTNPDVLRRWWAARPNMTSPGCDVDLRVGGGYVLRMRDEDSGELHVVVGEYREVERPRRLVYTWAWRGDGGPNPGHVSVVAVDFVGDGERTTVVLEHSGLPDEGSRRRHGEGWRATFENLARRVFYENDGDGRPAAA